MKFFSFTKDNTKITLRLALFVVGHRACGERYDEQRARHALYAKHMTKEIKDLDRMKEKVVKEKGLNPKFDQHKHRLMEIVGALYKGRKNHTNQANLCDIVSDLESTEPA